MDGKFGIEIEALGISPKQAAKVIEKAGIPCSFDGYSHNVKNTWKVVTDGSLPDDTRSFEIVSPPLQTQHIPEIGRVLSAIRKIGAGVNGSCGMHIHHDTLGMSDIAIKNTYYRYAKHEHKIDELFPYGRRGNMNSDYIKSLKHKQIELRHARTEPDALLSNIMCDRYWKLNPQSLVKYGTIEFRQHHGTLDQDEIENWLRYSRGFIAASNVEATINIVHPGDPIGYGNLIAGLTNSEIWFIDAILMKTERMKSYLLEKSKMGRIEFNEDILCNFTSDCYQFMKSLRQKGFAFRKVTNSYDMYYLDWDKSPTRQYAKKPVLQYQMKNESERDTMWTGIPKDVKDYYKVRRGFHDLAND